MKKLFIIIFLFGCLIARTATYTITDITQLKITSGNTYILIGSFISEKAFPWPSKINNVILTGDWHFIYTGNAKSFGVSYARNCTIENGEIMSSRTASVGLEPWYCKNLTIKNMRIHGAGWGIRMFFDTNTVVTNCFIYDTWDDNLYAEKNKDGEICYSIFDAANQGYWTDSTGGDCVQIAGKQGFWNIHDNQFYKIENGWKFGIIMGQSTQDLNDSAIIYNNVFNIRPWQMTATEDSKTHWVQGSSCIYLKPGKSYRLWNNTYFGGSNAIFTMATSSKNRLRISNEKFFNQTECICFGKNWDISVTNCTFRQGKSTYLKYDGTGDKITKCLFYDLANPKSGLSGIYNFTDNLINPVNVPQGYGAGNPDNSYIQTLETQYQQSLSLINFQSTKIKLYDSVNYDLNKQLARLKDWIQHSDTIMFNRDSCVFEIYGSGSYVKINKQGKNIEIKSNQ